MPIRLVRSKVDRARRHRLHSTKPPGISFMGMPRQAKPACVDPERRVRDKRRVQSRGVRAINCPKRTCREPTTRCPPEPFCFSIRFKIPLTHVMRRCSSCTAWSLLPWNCPPDVPPYGHGADLTRVRKRRSANFSFATSSCCTLRSLPRGGLDLVSTAQFHHPMRPGGGGRRSLKGFEATEACLLGRITSSSSTLHLLR